MIVRPFTARQLLLEAKKRMGAKDVHISATAAFRLAQALDAYGLSLAASALEVLGTNNVDRRQLRLDDLRRLSDEHVEEALDDGDA